MIVRKGTKPYDKAFVMIYIFFTILISVLAGFDVVRFQWSYLPALYSIPGIIAIIVSAIVSVWAMTSNPFFAGTMRIQNEKNHQVCVSGPYRYVRHPGYCSWIIAALGYPLVVGSIVCFVPVTIMIAVFVMRTYLEDTMLQKELSGYAEYAEKTNYRLIPFIW